MKRPISSCIGKCHSGPTTHLPARALAIAVVLMFGAMAILPVVAPASTSVAEVSTTGRDTTGGRADNLLVQENEWKNMSTTFTYDQVIIQDGGVLDIKKAGRITASAVILMGGSIIITGELKIQGGPLGGVCSLHGKGRYLKINTGGSLTVHGPNSGSELGTSQGGSGRIDIMMDEYIEVKGNIQVSGGMGYSPMSPWTARGLSGWSSAGGSADIIMKTRQSEGNFIYISGQVQANGGSGGDAPDAQGKDSGGFTDGGLVDGNVGAGGDVNITLSSYKVDIHSAKISATGGGGGDAGDGANGFGQDGGGGGGYVGGKSVTSSAGSGGAVAGRVGSGGWVTIDIFATTEAVIDGSASLTSMGGMGGAAGQGGDGGSNWGGGGGGGGGFGGGGGAAGTGNIPGASATVIGYVGAGGNVTYRFSAGDTFAITGDAVLTMTGGMGGNQIMGDGGGGSAGINSGGAGGGGGYGGGGGGGGWNSYGGVSIVAGRVGDGGDAFLEFDEENIAIGKFTELNLNGGAKGNGLSGPGAAGGNGATGGGGTGKGTINGIVSYNIPMMPPYLKYPKEGDIVSTMPTFQWDLVHDTGPSPVVQVKNYGLEVAKNKTFDPASIVISMDDISPTKNSFKPESLDGGEYWWRMKSIYGSAEFETKTSAKKSFYYNKPPELSRFLPPIRINEDENHTHIINLDDYFTDDLYPGTLEYGIVDDAQVHNILMTTDGFRNQWVNINLTEDFFGQEYFNFSATDDGGLTGYSGLVSVIVLPVNDPPVIQGLDDQLVTEDQESILYISELLFDQESWNPFPTQGLPTYQIANMNLRTDSDFITVEKYPDMTPPEIHLIMLYTEEVYTEYVNLTVTDGFATVIYPFIVNVTPVNDLPTLSEVPKITLLEDTPKTIDLKQYSYDEEDSDTELRWNVRIRDKRLLDWHLEEGNLLRLIPKAEVSGTTNLDLTVYDLKGEYTQTTTVIEIVSVNDPPRPTVDHIWVPKGVEYSVDFLTILEDVDGEPTDIEVVSAEIVNESTAIGLAGLTLATFNYPDGPTLNDTLVLVTSDGLNETEWNLTINLGYAPVMKKIPKVTFIEDETFHLNVAKYINDEDDEVEDMEWEVGGFDPSFIDPDMNPKSGKLSIKAYKVGTTNMTITVTDSSGFMVTQEVKVTVKESDLMVFLDRNPAILYSIALLVVIIVLALVLIVTSKRFGVPFKGFKESKEEEEESEEEKTPPVGPDGAPPPPDGWVEGEGWTEGGGPDAPPPEGAPPDEGKEAPAGPEPAAEPAGPTLVPPPTAPGDTKPRPVPKPKSKPHRPKGEVCARCKEEVPHGAIACPSCGAPTDREARKRLRELKRKERRGDLTEEEENELAELEEGTEGGTPPSPPAGGEGAGPRCPSCGEPIEPDFIRCPSCNADLE